MNEARAGDWSFLDSILGMGADLGVYTVPGDGMIDYVAVFKELRGYSGWVVLEAEQEHIFERFYRSQQHEADRSSGTGLGLPIARLPVELHGGRLWVEDAPGGGSCFHFTLPTPG